MSTNLILQTFFNAKLSLLQLIKTYKAYPALSIVILHVYSSWLPPPVTSYTNFVEFIKLSTEENEEGKRN